MAGSAALASFRYFSASATLARASGELAFLASSKALLSCWMRLMRAWYSICAAPVVAPSMLSARNAFLKAASTAERSALTPISSIRWMLPRIWRPICMPTATPFSSGAPRAYCMPLMMSALGCSAFMAESRPAYWARSDEPKLVPNRVFTESDVAADTAKVSASPAVAASLWEQEAAVIAARTAAPIRIFFIIYIVICVIVVFCPQR